MDVKNVQVFCILSLWKAPDPNRTYWRKRRPSGHSAVDLHPIWWGSPPLICIYIYYIYTRAPKTNIRFRPWKSMVGSDKFKFGMSYFQRRAASFRESVYIMCVCIYIYIDLNSIIHHPVWHPKTARTWPQWETLTYDVPWDTDLLRGILIRLTELQCN